jgi:hypothetical protein
MAETPTIADAPAVEIMVPVFICIYYLVFLEGPVPKVVSTPSFIIASFQIYDNTGGYVFPDTVFSLVF